MDKDRIWKEWRFSHILSRTTRQTGARAVKRDRENSTLNLIWGLQPIYAGKVIRRRTEVAHA